MVEEFSEIKTGYKALVDHTIALGFGGVMSIFTPDFILKAELGYSEIGSGIYLGTGYSF